MKEISKEKGLDIEVSSAGILTADGLPMSVNSEEALAEKGIGLKGFSSTQLTREIAEDADLIITMSESHKKAASEYFGGEDKVYTLSEFAGESGNMEIRDIRDPYGLPLDYYIECRNDIEERIVKMAEKLTDEVKGI